MGVTLNGPNGVPEPTLFTPLTRIEYGLPLTRPGIVIEVLEPS
jgi:hypothetical protein